MCCIKNIYISIELEFMSENLCVRLITFSISKCCQFIDIREHSLDDARLIKRRSIFFCKKNYVRARD